MKKLAVLLILLLVLGVSGTALAQDFDFEEEESVETVEEAVESTASDDVAPDEADFDDVDFDFEEESVETVEEAVESTAGDGDGFDPLNDFEDFDFEDDFDDEFDAIGSAELDDSELSGAAAATDGAWTSTLYVSNPNSEAATAEIAYYDASGAKAATAQKNMSAFGSAVVDVSSLSDNFKGAAVVSSDKALAVQVALNAGADFDRTLYTGYTQGGNTISSPGTLCKTYKQTTELVVMNVGSSAATVDVNYLAAGNFTPATKKTTHTIPANSSKYLDACTELGVDGNWNGSVTVKGQTGNEALTGIIFLRYTDSPKATTYETVVGEGSSKIFFPQALNRSFGTEQSTFYAVQNVGTSSTDVKVEAFDKDNQSVGSTTKTLAAGEKVTITPDDLSIPARASFSGSSVATASANGQIAAITQLRVFADKAGCGAGAGIASQYLNPGTKTSDSSNKVAIPWVEFKQADTDWQSFVAIQNVGDSATGAITVSYYGPDGNAVGTRNVTSIGGGGKTTVNSKDDIASGGDNFFGSVVVESSNTSDKLVVLTSNKQTNACAGANTLGIPMQ